MALFLSAIKRFLISRKTITFLLVVIFLAVVMGYIFPQRFSTPQETMMNWYQEHLILDWFSYYLGLDHIYTTYWFALLLFIFSLSLSISSYKQFKLARKRTFGASRVSGGRVFETEFEKKEKIVTAIKAHGFLRFYKDQAEQRFVKHPWGYWGGFLLHLGILVVIVSSLLVFLTTKRARLELYEGESYFPGSSWSSEERGIIADEIFLPVRIRLKSVRPEFWATDNLKQLSTVFEFTGRSGIASERVVAVNQSIMFQGLKIYQGRKFGTAFFVEFLEENGELHGEILYIPRPARRDKAGYRDFRSEWSPYLLRTKYYADAEKRSMNSDNPLLVLRLASGKEAAGELSLKKGERGQLGPYTVRLVEIKRWSGIVFIDITGMPGIYIGFFIIILGSALHYFTPPREVALKKRADRFTVRWKAGRFAGFYSDEPEKLRSAFMENTNTDSFHFEDNE